MPLLLVLSIVSFVSSLSMRIVDPTIPDIARDMGVAVETAALLASAYAFPYALSQLPVGTLGDALGKARFIKFSLAGLAASLVLSVFAQSFATLFVARMLAGVSAGGIVTLAFAIVGDRFPVAERQVALSRLLMAMLSSALFGAFGAGLIAAHFGWRAVALAAATLTLFAFAISLRWLPGGDRREAFSFRPADIRSDYMAVLRHPLAPVCYLGVFGEGVLVFGFMPYIAGLLEARGMGGIQEAGIVLTGMGLGGILYTLLVRTLLDRFGRTTMMRGGAVICLAGLLGVAASTSWPQQMAALFVLGAGFYPVHNSLQTTATDLAPTARGKAMALHAASFFTGQACGPLAYRLGFETIGPSATLAVAGVAMCLLALWIAGRFRAYGMATAAAGG